MVLLRWGEIFTKFSVRQINARVYNGRQTKLTVTIIKLIGWEFLLLFERNECRIENIIFFSSKLRFVVVTRRVFAVRYTVPEVISACPERWKTRLVNSKFFFKIVSFQRSERPSLSVCLTMSNKSTFIQLRFSTVRRRVNAARAA